MVLFCCYLTLLGGKFTLDRVFLSAPAIDLRWLGIAGTASIAGLWIGVAGSRMTHPVTLGAGRIWFLAWVGWLALSATWARPLARVNEYWADLWFLGAVVTLAWIVASRMSRDAVSVIWVWIYWTGLVYFLGAIVGGADAQGRYSAFGGGPNVFVRVMLLAALAALYLTARRGRRIYLLVLPILMVGAILSGSRGGLIAFAATCLIGGWPMLRRLPRGTSIRIVLASIAVALSAEYAAGAVVNPALTDRYVQQTVEAHYDSGRTTILHQAWQLWLDNFWVGSGVDGYWATSGHRIGYEYPHNLFVGSAAEGGLVALFLLVGGVVAFWLASRRTTPTPREALFYRLAALFVVVASFFSGNYYDSRMMWLFLGLAALEGRRGLLRGGADGVRPVGTVNRRVFGDAPAARYVESASRVTAC